MMHFPFLSLPKELRLQIYESIPPTTQHWAFPNATKHALFTSPFPSADGTIIFVVQQVSNAVLATCRQIHDEAHGIVTRRRRQQVKLDVPRVIIDLSIVHVLLQKQGLFALATKLRSALMRKGGNAEAAKNDRTLILNGAGVGGTGDRTQKYLPDTHESVPPPVDSAPLTATDRLSCFTILCAYALRSSPAFAVDIRPFNSAAPAPTEAHLSTQLTRLCGLSGGHFEHLDISVGMADQRFFPSPEEHGKWEGKLAVLMKQMDMYMEQVVEFLEITTVKIRKAEKEEDGVGMGVLNEGFGGSELC